MNAMWLTSFLSYVIAFAPQDTAARPAASTTAQGGTPTVEISARLVRADATSSGSSTSRSSTGSFDGYLWADANCNLAGGDRDTANNATAGWKFSTHVTQSFSGLATVQIEWTRVWENNRRLTAESPSSITRALTAGDRVALDKIDLPATAACGTASLRLEAGLIRETATIGGTRGGRGGGMGAFGAGGRGAAATPGARPGGSRGGGGMGANAAGAAGTAGRGTGAGTGTGAGSSTATTPTDPNAPAAAAAGAAGGRGGRGAGGARGAAGGAGAGQAATPQDFMLRPNAGGRGGYRLGGEPGYTAELWLVHAVPTDAVSGANNSRDSAMRSVREDVVQQSLRFTTTGSGFAFPALTVPVPGRENPVVVLVMGTLSGKTDHGDPSTLIVTVSRQIIGSDKSTGTIGGSTTKEVPWPKPGDVLSFELPAASGAGSEAIANDRFSIRLRIGGGTLGGIAGTMRGRGGE